MALVEEEIGKVRKPPACYRAIAALPFRLILTTHYDTLLEETLDGEGVAYQKVLGAHDLARCRRTGLRLVKLYGCITERDSMVITEEDRVAFFDRWPHILNNLGIGLPGRTWLFLGCDLMDPDFRRIYRDVAPRLSRAGQSAYLVEESVPDPLKLYCASKGLTVIEADPTELLSEAVAYKEVRAAELASAEPAHEPLELEVTPWTETGWLRRVNQDCVQVWTPSDPQASQRGSLFLVADGMGGHNAGEVASHLAADLTVEEYYADAHTDAGVDVSVKLIHAVGAANRAIYQQASANPAQRGMGTTVVAAVVRGQELYVANVGDSRAYLIRDGVIDQITLDHSWVAEEVRAGTMTPEQAIDHPQKNLLTRALGIARQVEVDIFQRKLERGAIVVLCSDGLTDYVRDHEIEREVIDRPTAAAVKHLANLAKGRGGSDDISVVVIEVG